MQVNIFKKGKKTFVKGQGRERREREARERRERENGKTARRRDQRGEDGEIKVKLNTIMSSTVVCGPSRAATPAACVKLAVQPIACLNCFLQKKSQVVLKTTKENIKTVQCWQSL